MPELQHSLTTLPVQFETVVRMEYSSSSQLQDFVVVVLFCLGRGGGGGRIPWAPSSAKSWIRHCVEQCIADPGVLT